MVAVGGTIAEDAATVLRSRLARFPDEVPWTDPAYPDFVLSSITQGVVRSSPVEVARTRLIQERLRLALPQLKIGGRQLAVELPERPPAGGAIQVVAQGEARGITPGQPSRICPGQLRGMVWDGVPASCAVVEVADHHLRIRFLGVDGDDLDPPELVS